MTNVKVIDLFGIKYDQMEKKINGVLNDLQDEGATVKDVKVMGEKLSQCSVFVVYEN